ncbi:MAG TPA: HAD family phosphatase, partial [Methanomicrobiales archaeon]|nr:HAD family phosphatase [Methanomicrobiales archaeon]
MQSENGIREGIPSADRIPGDSEEARCAPIRAAIFDMDNTLFDFVSAQIAACTSVVEYLGRGEGTHLFEYFRREGKGFEDPENILEYMIDIGLEIDGKYAHCCSIYEGVKLAGISPYPGMQETVSHLRGRGFSLSVVTDALEKNALRRLERAGLNTHFDCVITPDLTGKRKPEPDPFLLALKRMGVTAEET